MWSVRYCCSISTKTGTYRQHLLKLSDIKFHENLSLVSRVIICRQMWRSQLVQLFVKIALGMSYLRLHTCRLYHSRFTGWNCVDGWPLLLARPVPLLLNKNEYPVWKYKYIWVPMKWHYVVAQLQLLNVFQNMRYMFHDTGQKVEGSDRVNQLSCTIL